MFCLAEIFLLILFQLELSTYCKQISPKSLFTSAIWLNNQTLYSRGFIFFLTVEQDADPAEANPIQVMQLLSRIGILLHECPALLEFKAPHDFYL